MKSRVLTVGLMAVIVFGTFLFNGAKKSEDVVKGINSKASTKSENTATLNAKTKSMGAVEVEVTPINVGPGFNMTFNLALNTHSVELGYDYTQIVKAKDDKGNVYNTISWSGGEGGHHLSGDLVFEELSENATQVSLTIDSIDDEVAVFEWNI